jgi:hypothetical protein
MQRIHMMKLAEGSWHSVYAMGWKIKKITVHFSARTKCPWLWDPFSLPINGHQRLFPGDKAAKVGS